MGEIVAFRNKGVILSKLLVNDSKEVRGFVVANPILLIDDDQDFTSMLGKRLSQKGMEVLAATNASDGLSMLQGHEVDLVLLDVGLPDKSGVDVVQDIKALKSEVPIIMVSASGETRDIVGAMKFGASDYVKKPFSHQDLLDKVENLLQIRRLKSTEQQLDDEPEAFNTIIGRSVPTKQLIHEVSKIANSDATVLLRGESGTGKTLIAEVIHRHSGRKDKPFVTVNCAAIPENLLESELFGHVRGSFTGAVKDKIGKFQQADHGTIFLDEIGELPPELQVKILRVLQGREFEKVGGLETIKVDVRVIAATNRNLEDAIREGKFREDLFYRLNVLPIHVPALRERREDIPLLLNHFLNHYGAKAGKHFEPIAESILTRLMNYPWTGNIRELQNVVERAVILGKEPQLEMADFTIKSSGLGTEVGNDTEHSGNGHRPNHFSSLKDLEHQMLMKALEESGGNISKVAKILGVGRDTVYRRLKKYNIGLRR